jgi:site-specific recombinase XerC
MHDLVYELKRLAERHHEGSYSTQANRKAMLMQIGEQLYELGFKKLASTELKGRHINRLLKRWQDEGLSPNTIRNRLAVLRWWGEKIGNPGAVLAQNTAYGLPTRERVTRVSKAQALPEEALARVRDRYVQLSLQLQQAFGLRREESIKIWPAQADHGDALVLQGSWTKGGRPREVPIRTEDQRRVLEQAKALAAGGALIPPTKNYAQQLRRYEYECQHVGLHMMHGLRHAYAQARFLELTGFACPAAGGPGKLALTAPQREADYDARVMISAELGHGREQITTAYLGR